MHSLSWKLRTALFFLAIMAFSFVMATRLIAAPDWIGNIIASSIPENFTNYWNQVTPENGTKWDSIEMTRDTFNWTMADRCYNFAKSHGFPFTFDNLIWGSMHAAWLYNISESEQLAEITEWIQAVGQRYPDCNMIIVVNEPLHSKPAWRNALGGEGATGWDWVIKSFELARQYCPNSKLCINEYGVEWEPDACSQYVSIINLLKERNLIDGIGIQCHLFYTSTPADTALNQCLSQLDTTGLPIYASELDIPGDDATQLSRYQSIFPILYNHPRVKGITIWGYIVGQTWRDSTGLVSSGSIGAGERPAMQWLKAMLPHTVTPTPTLTPTPTPITGKLGDVNKDNAVTITDALLIAQYSAGFKPTNFDPALADVDRNGSIQIVDALRVAQCSAGLGSCIF